MFIRKLFVPLQTILCTCREKWHYARIKDREVRRCTEGLTLRLTRDYAMVGWTDGRDAVMLLPTNQQVQTSSARAGKAKLYTIWKIEKMNQQWSATRNDGAFCAIPMLT